MKRLHVHVSVDDLAASARFYSTLFAAKPTVAKSDYVGPEPTPLSPGAISGHAGAVMWPHVSGPRWP